MQAGFSMLEAGCVSSKNVANILYKNLMDACLGAVTFWALGYGFAYGDANDGYFIGASNFFLMDESNEGGTYQAFFFQWAFAATAATIVSGAVAERTKLSAYFAYAFFITVWIYPVVVHWGWDSEGWLVAWNANYALLTGDPSKSTGMIDFAGSGIVHMVGGFSGLVGAKVVGPRKGRFTVEYGSDGKPIVHQEHNKLLASLGVAILWFGWYGFNCGSTLMVSGGASALAGKVAVTTTLGAAGGALATSAIARVVDGHWDLMASLNGVLAGLVSITAPCSVVEPWAALVIGILGAFVYFGSSKLLAKLHIDDPLDAAPIHGFCGFWGLLACGIFGTDANVAYAYGKTNTAISSGEQFLVQLIGGISIMAWTLIMATILFVGINLTIGMRVDEATEKAGLDVSEHGGNVYANDVMTLLSSGEGGSAKVAVAPEAEMAKTESA